MSPLNPRHTVSVRLILGPNKSVNRHKILGIDTMLEVQNADKHMCL